MSYTQPAVIWQISDATKQSVATKISCDDPDSICEWLNTQINKTLFEVFGFEDEPEYIGICVAASTEIVLNDDLLQQAAAVKTQHEAPFLHNATLIIVPNFC